jgi:hydroxymethylglutaryl-CoA lyase
LAQRVTYPSRVRVREVGPRDGIQAEKAQVSTQDKIRLIDALSASGLRYIEAVSFVSPKAVPQMADAREVWAGMTKNTGVFYSALVPNARGAEVAA